MTDSRKFPAHIAIIPDGNGRWAERRKAPRPAGHAAGMKAVKETVKKAADMGVRELSIFAFSTENGKRSEDEVLGLFGLLTLWADRELDELRRAGVRVRVWGDYETLPAETVRSLNKSVAATADNTGMRFNIAINYGGRAEIARAAVRLARDARAGVVSDADMDARAEALVAQRLYTAGIPDPDLVIRTSGEQRLSNFLLWQCAYSEFVFTDVLWPDFTPDDLEKAVETYMNRSRRFGGL